MSFFLDKKPDYARHNDEVRSLWNDYGKGIHDRIPVSVSGSIRNFLSNPEINKTGFTFKDFFTKAEAQVNCQLEYQYYTRHNIICDREMGLPEKGWQLSLDFQNSYEQAWFGCPITYFGDTDVPDTVEILREAPDMFYDWTEPDPFLGRGDFMKRAMEVYEKMMEICRAGLDFHGLPVKPPTGFPCAGTDGVFDCAIKLRGAVEVMTDMFDNPKYFHDLMDYITRNTIRRMKAHREWNWDHDPDYRGNHRHKGGFFYADDSIAMLSCEQFKEFILPYMKRIFDEFHDGGGCTIHLCGNATHHFKFLAGEFNVKSFDTGFPVDHGWLRKQLGPGIEISGGPTIMAVKDGTTEQIVSEARRICESGVMEGGRFILIAANNLAPCTPVENINALYEAGKRYGRTGR
ncbi:MAG: uroporphyrinogen decarboxylase family protein [Victivallales bacterium]